MWSQAPASGGRRGRSKAAGLVPEEEHPDQQGADDQDRHQRGRDDSSTPIVGLPGYFWLVHAAAQVLEVCRKSLIAVSPTQTRPMPTRAPAEVSQAEVLCCQSPAPRSG